MKLKQISLYNLFSFKNRTILFNEPPSVILGPNNSGKSNIFRSIKLLIDELSSSKMNKSYIFDENSNSILTIRLKLNRIETSSLIDFLYIIFIRLTQKILMIMICFIP